MGLTYFSSPTWFKNGTDGVVDPQPYFNIANGRPGFESYERGDCTLFSQPLSSDRWLKITELCVGAQPPAHLNVGVGPERLTDGLYQPWAVETEEFLGPYVYQACPEVGEILVPLAAPSRVHTVRVWRRCDDPESRASPLQVFYGGLPESTRTAPFGSSLPTDGNVTHAWTACGNVSTPEELECIPGAAPAEQFWERQCDGDMTTATLIRISRVNDGNSIMISIPELEVYGNPARVTPSTTAVRVDSAEATANLTAFAVNILG
jgi:hypothetical protein